MFHAPNGFFLSSFYRLLSPLLSFFSPVCLSSFVSFHLSFLECIFVVEFRGIPRLLTKNQVLILHFTVNRLHTRNCWDNIHTVSCL